MSSKRFACSFSSFRCDSFDDVDDGVDVFVVGGFPPRDRFRLDDDDTFGLGW